MSSARPYVGRFAPSPTGPLHAGSIVAALGSRLDALAHGGKWLVRIEDLDPPREQPGAADGILRTLRRLGMEWDGEVVYQSTRGEAYEQALQRLRQAGHVYPCACSRREVADSVLRPGQVREAHAELIYPGTCRAGLPPGRTARAWRLRVPPEGSPITWQDRSDGLQSDDLALTAGDFVVRRADGLWSYQLAVVVDDAAQGVTHVVRGQDLAGSTARQTWIQTCLGLATPQWLHLPVVRSASGEKLSKQTGAESVDQIPPIDVLRAASRHLRLDLHPHDSSVAAFWETALDVWRRSRWTPG